MVYVPPLIVGLIFFQPRKTFLNAGRSVVTTKLKHYLIFRVIGSQLEECSHACLTQVDC